MSKLALLGGQKTIVRDANSPKKGGNPESFEDAFARYVDAKYALPVSSGQTALNAALAAAGVGPGDEVIVVSFTWLASVSCVLHNNAIPIFVDIDDETFTMDPKDVKRKITERTKVILPVDIYGHPAPVVELKQIAEKNNLVLVEDAAQATGAQINGEKVGSVAHITTFSFAGKPLSSSSGGVLTTNSQEFYERAALAGQHPSMLSQIVTTPELRKYVATGGYGDNHRPDGHALTLAYENLKTMDENTDARIENANFLTSELSKIPGITPPYVKPEVRHVYHMYTCLYDENHFGVPRDKFVAALNAEGVTTWTYIDGANYVFESDGTPCHVGPLHHRTIYQELDLYGKGCPFQCPHGMTPKYEIGSLPVTEQVTKQEFNFLQHDLTSPNDLDMMKRYMEAIHKVIDNINELRK